MRWGREFRIDAALSRLDDLAMRIEKAVEELEHNTAVLGDTISEVEEQHSGD